MLAKTTTTWKPPWAPAGATVVTLAACLFVLVAAGSDVRAQEGSAPDDYRDPLAFFRADMEAQDYPVTIAYRGTGEVRRFHGRRLLVGSQESYLRSATVASIFQASRLWDGVQLRLTLQVQDKRFQLTAGTRLVVTEHEEILLPVPVLFVDGDLWLPMVFLTDLLGPQTRQMVVWDPATDRLEVGSAEYDIIGLRVEDTGRATAVRVECKRPFGFRATSSGPGVIELKIYGGLVDPAEVARHTPSGLVLGVRNSQRRDHALITVLVDDLVGSFRTSTGQDGKEIVLIVEEEQVSALPDVVPRGRVDIVSRPVPADVTRAIAVRTVVIDPGHGGDDHGTGGPRGLLEKNVNLAVARALNNYLTDAGLTVVMTRNSDEQLPLAKRSERANQAGGDIFISLHCNSWFSESASGVETYFLSPAKSDWSKSVERLENQADGQVGDVEFIVWDLVQNQFISSSSDLAELIQDEVTGRLSIPDRGVRQAGFRVLVGAYMPAVLVEMGFLSNPGEARRLADPQYHQRLAEALGRGVLAFKARYEKAGSGGVSAGRSASGDPAAGGDSVGDDEQERR